MLKNTLKRLTPLFMTTLVSNTTMPSALGQHKLNPLLTGHTTEFVDAFSRLIPANQRFVLNNPSNFTLRPSLFNPSLTPVEQGCYKAIKVNQPFSLSFKGKKFNVGLAPVSRIVDNNKGEILIEKPLTSGMAVDGRYPYAVIYRIVPSKEPSKDSDAFLTRLGQCLNP